jgi:2-phosphosulfolactate phosphatase
MTVVIDSFPSRNDRYFQDYAVVAIDVIRASTTAITAVSAGRKCFPVVSVEAAFQLRERFPDCLLAGEVSGLMPAGFNMNNSPAELARRSDHERPLVLLSSSGTKLMAQSGISGAAYVACLRNYKAVAAYIAGRHERVAVLGAATRGEFREEDQLCCTRIAAELVRLGHQPEDRQTVRLIQRWSTSSVLACAAGNSAAYLRRSGQLDDLNFILSHVNDVSMAFQMSKGEVVPVSLVGEPDKKQPDKGQATLRLGQLEPVES